MQTIMQAIKHLIFVDVFPWVHAAVSDAKAWLAGALAAATAAGHDFLTGMDVSQALSWTRKEWALHLLKIIGGGILGWLVVGKPHQSAADIATKLAALTPEQRAALLVGSDVKTPPTPPAAA